jgi:SAM-dependent methyltransferase
MIRSPRSSLAAILGYPQDWIETLPPGAVVSMAGTGNPFALGEIKPGERVVDCGSGAGADALIAAHLVGPAGRVVGIDMTPEMVEKARANAAEAGLTNVDFREGVVEALPVQTGWADVVISNGFSTSSPTRRSPSPRCTACFGRAAASRPPTSSSSGPFRPVRSKTSVYGPAASPAGSSRTNSKT